MKNRQSNNNPGGGRGRGNGAGRGNGGGRGRGGGGGNGDPDYQRKAWETQGIKVDSDGVLKVNCRVCGLNTTHSSRYHSAWASNPSTFRLPDNNVYVKACQSITRNLPKPPPTNPPSTPPPSQPPGQNPSGQAGSLVLDRASLESKMSQYERTSTDPNASSIVDAFRFLLYLLWDICPVPTFGLVLVSSVSPVIVRPDPPKPRPRRSRSSRSRYLRFRRRHLHYNLVRRCYSRRCKSVPWSYRTRQHRRWRRKKYRQRSRYRVKRHQLKWSKFLTPQLSSRSLWNLHRKVNAEFLGADSDSFLPFASYGLIPEEVLDKFCAERADSFLSTTKLLHKFNNMSLFDGAKSTVQRANLFHSADNDITNRAPCFKCHLQDLSIGLGYWCFIWPDSFQR
eukprot:scaffold56008_cov50-Cyclotella_meneghiniana.AAC.1